VVYPDEDAWWEHRMGCPHVNDASLAKDDFERFKTDAFALVRAAKRREGIQESRSAVFVVVHKPG
jgi:hypothetical protein